MGTDRRAESLARVGATEAAAELRAEFDYEERAVLGELGGGHCDGLQCDQFDDRVLSGETRLGEQCGGGGVEWDAVQEHEGREADDDFGRFGGGRCGGLGGRLILCYGWST